MKAGLKNLSALALSFVLIFATSFGFGQGITTGSITGLVTDPQGAVIPNAKVTAVESASGATLTTQTTASGAFAFRNVPIGTYSVRVEAPSFNPKQIRNVAVDVGRETSLGEQKLQVGTSETVTVEESIPLVETTTSQVSSTFATRQLTDLPIGNTFDNIALLAPGVANAHSNSFSNSNGVNLSVNGQRGRSNNFQIDGQSNNDNSIGGPAFFFGNQDALQEVQVVTNQFSAEYGRNMGSVVNYITKQGTNSFHGTAYELYQGSFLSSLANEQKSPLFGICLPGHTKEFGLPCKQPFVPKVVNNRWGGTLGGPVLKNKLWFFGSTNYQHVRNGVSPATSGTSITPTPNGLTQLQAAFPNNLAVAALTTFGPYAIKTGNPAPSGNIQNITVTNGTTTVPIEFGQVQRLIPAVNDDKEISGRVDYQLSGKDRIFGRHLYQNTLQTGNVNNSNATIARGGFINTAGRNQAVGLDWTRSWTNSFVNQARVSYFRENLGFDQGAFPQCTQGNLSNCPARIDFAGAPLFSIGLANNLPQGRIVNNYQYQDNATWQLGNHTVKFGGEYQRQRSPNVFLPNFNGTFSFSASGLNSVVNATGINCTTLSVSGPGCAFSRFLIGGGTLTLADGPAKLPFKENDVASYLQDDWKVNSSLTLNLGLRYEWFQQAINTLHDITVARETGSGAFWDPGLPLTRKTFPSVPEDLNNFSPNIGFAWAPQMLGAGKTVIRGGYRVNYDPAFYNIFLNVATAAPVVNLGSIACTGTNNCLPANGILGASVRAKDLSRIPKGTGVDPNTRNQTTVSSHFHNPYTQNYTLGIQREITPRIAAELRYVGNHTVGNFETIDANPQLAPLAAAFPSVIPPGVTFCTATGAPGLGRPDCSKTNVRLRDNTAFSIYNGLQSRLNFSNYHGLTAGLSYTYSRTIDNVSEIFSTGSAGTTVAGAPNPFDLANSERAVSGVNFTHLASLFLNYDLPWFSTQQGIVGRVLGGYNVNFIYTYNSGEPLSVSQTVGQGSLCDASFSTAFFGSLDTCRPFLTNPSDPYNPASYAPNNAATAIVLRNPFGVARNTLYGQSFNQLDASVYKNTKFFGEKLNLQLQATASNILNRQYRGSLDPLIEDFTTANDPQNGFLTNHFNSTNNNIRTVTLGAKIIF